MAQVKNHGNHGLFLHGQLTHLHTGNTHKKVSNIASDADITENNCMFVMLWNISVISHLIFPQCFFSQRSSHLCGLKLTYKNLKFCPKTISNCYLRLTN